MNEQTTGGDPPQQRSAINGPSLIDTLRLGPVGCFLAGDPPLELGTEEPAAAEASHATVVSVFQLADVADYRHALRAWFRPVRVGGHLVLLVSYPIPQTVPTLRTTAALGGRYTPRQLIEEIEESLVPNSYRIRHLSVLDVHRDNASAPADTEADEKAIVLVLERIASPQWKLASVPEPTSIPPRPVTPDYEFEPSRTRIEVANTPQCQRVLLLNVDRPAEFVLGIAALERARTLFVGLEITLVVSSASVVMARGLGLADRIISFDFVSSNAVEGESGVADQAASFHATVADEYDIAIDLGVGRDSRFLLEMSRARLRAGVGTRTQFPFLDIFLPVDPTRRKVEAARDDWLGHQAFAAQGATIRSDYRVFSRPHDVERHCAIIWGPYRQLGRGRYIFEPHLELDLTAGGLLMIDVGLNGVRTARKIIEAPGNMRLRFAVETASAEFEFRIWAVDGAPPLGFSFFGGQLIREGAPHILRQSEHARLLLALIAMRLGPNGILVNLGDVAVGAIPQ